MKSKSIIIFTLIFLIAVSISAQESLNAYKYVIIPKKYSFLKNEDQYQLNSLTKFLFNKEGFEALFDDEQKPTDLAVNPCMGLTAKVNNESSLFTTKLTIDLVNCKNETIFTSGEGKSKEKDYKKAYHEALRNAFKSFKDFNYKYSPDHDIMIVENPKIKNSKKLPEPSSQITEEKYETTVAKDIIKTVKQDIPDAPESTEVVSEEVKTRNTNNTEIPKDLLYAQPNTLGYQLVDNTPKVVYILLKTDNTNVFILKDKNGILTKDGNKWIAEYYNGNTLVKKELNVKF